MMLGEVITAMIGDPAKKFARKGWNGKNMFIYLTLPHKIKGSDWTGPKECVQKRDVMQDDGVTITEHFVLLSSHIDMKAADGTVVIGWLASQTDLIADDWVEVE